MLAFERGREPEAIIGATDRNEHLQFRMKWLAPQFSFSISSYCLLSLNVRTIGKAAIIPIWFRSTMRKHSAPIWLSTILQVT